MSRREKKTFTPLVVLAAGLLILAAGARADEGVVESQEDELSRRATDPTASPPSFAFINDVTASYRDSAAGAPMDAPGYQIRFQPVVPFKAWGAANILRMTVPFQVSGPYPHGLADVTVFDLVILPQSWGRLGVGAVGSFSAATGAAPAKATGGPAVGFVAQISKTLNLGLFNQNLFGGGVALSSFQPIAAYQLGHGWSLSLGDLQWLYDWKKGTFASLPLGLQIGKVLPVFGQPMRFSVNPQYDLKDLPGNSRIKVALTIQLLLPEKKG